MTSIPDIIIERAAELWCRALRAPTRDNGDTGERGAMTSILSTMNAERDLAAVDDFDAAIERFRSILVARLKFLRDNAGKLTGNTAAYGPEKYFFHRTLSCDYSPDEILADAATEAGLPTSAFSWKSDVWMQPDRVAASFGHAARAASHYPLPDGSWLICDLGGSDMSKIIDAVMDGRLPQLTVEAPAGSEGGAA